MWTYGEMSHCQHMFINKPTVAFMYKIEPVNKREKGAWP